MKVYVYCQSSQCIDLKYCTCTRLNKLFIILHLNILSVKQSATHTLLLVTECLIMFVTSRISA